MKALLDRRVQRQSSGTSLSISCSCVPLLCGRTQSRQRRFLVLKHYSRSNPAIRHSRHCIAAAPDPIIPGTFGLFPKFCDCCVWTTFQT